MAPSRRKGASKAAAAAAARRQWKVGDLVLAKVKGFPAWPATVSEPSKWGYRSDWKKVLVYFFGTQQIAFCNPADVEAFTEEKKQSLLVKRQGKGADFVRAVQEIIESYEKSKKQDQDDDCNAAGGDNQANCGSSLYSSVSKDPTDTCKATVELRLKSSYANTNQNDTSLATEVAATEAKIDAYPEKESVSEEPLDNVLVKETPLLTTYSSRKRSGGSRSQKSVAQQKVQPVRRVRSSSRMESSRFQYLVSSNDVRTDGSLRRTKRVRKSTDASESDDVESSALISNGSFDENGSEIATVDSDAVSLNEGSTMDYSCKPEHSETVVDCLDEDVELSKGLDFQIKAVVIKRRRKPLRKRANNESAEHPTRMDVEADMDLGVNITRQNLQNTSENLNGGYSKDDGDKHLPLVKRARIRMGKLAAAADDCNSSSPVDEKPVIEGTVLALEQMSSPICSNGSADRDSLALKGSPADRDSLALKGSPADRDSVALKDSPADRDSLVLKGTLVNVSPLKGDNQVQGSGPETWKVTRNQLGCLAGSEAALPPSKRLHRALEAMSANVAEDQACADNNPSPTLSTLDDQFRGAEGKETNGLEQHGMDPLLSGDSDQISKQSEVPMKIGSNTSLEPDICSGSANSPNNQKGDLDKDICMEPMNHVSCDTDKDQSVEHLSPHLDKSQASFRRDCGALKQSNGDSVSVDLSNFCGENRDEQFNSSEHVEMSSDPVRGTNRTCEISPQDGSIESQCTAEHNSHGKTDSMKSQTDSSLVNGRCEIGGELQLEQRQKSTSTMISDVNSDKDVVVQSNHSADGVDTPARVSPSNASLCHVSTSESANIIQSNGQCSPNVQSCQNKSLCVSIADDDGKVDCAASERSKFVSKCSNNSEANAALSSFENMLPVLTRTKESIARATRIAIDCAKFGVSAKVMEILARNLERELSLHRRVDLFFLVDSIAQCSRGLKGDVGGIYPSAIQAALPRLLHAAAPSGSSAQENRRQCLKVLKLWLERRILPEAVVRHHIRQLDSLSSSSSVGAFSRRSARTSRTERALDDPVRDMEGMLVDEYGSNSSFQLPGFCMPRMLKDEDEGSDSDGESFEAVTPEHYTGTPEEQETNPAIVKHRHILEDVDGELEMEDVAPSESEMNSTVDTTGINSVQTSREHCDQHFPLPFAAPPLPHDMPPSSPPLPSSPPPPPPPPPPAPSIHPPPISDPFANGVDSTVHTSLQRQEDIRPTVPPPVAPGINSTRCSNAVSYHGPESREQPPVPMQVSDCSSFNSFPVHPVNNMQQHDGPNFHHNAYPPRLPHPPQSNQFSYVNSGQHMNSMRDGPPPPYSNRYYSPNMDGGHFYNSHERMKPAPNDHRENWRFPPPPYPGPWYDDNPKATYGHGSYGGPPCEPPRLPNHGWGYHPPAMNHINSFHGRPPPEGAVPVGSRAPGGWWPR